MARRRVGYFAASAAFQLFSARTLAYSSSTTRIGAPYMYATESSAAFWIPAESRSAIRSAALIPRGWFSIATAAGLKRCWWKSPTGVMAAPSAPATGKGSETASARIRSFMS